MTDTRSFVLLLAVFAASLSAWISIPVGAEEPPTLSERMEMAFRYAEIPGQMPGLALLEPHWLPDGDRFGYVQKTPENTVVQLVDPVADSESGGAPEAGAGRGDQP